MIRDDPHAVAELDDGLLRRARVLSCATLHEAAGRIGALPHALKPLDPRMSLCGPALPVHCARGDNLALHHAIYAARPGEVLVVAARDGAAFGYWGDIMTTAAQQRRIAGLVISGGVRDSRQLVALGFPTFSASIAVRGTVKDPATAGSLGDPVVMGGVRIERGDLVRGDADGVIVLPKAKAAEWIAKAEDRVETEQHIVERLRGGATTLEIYGLPELAPQRRTASGGARRSIEVAGLSHGHLPIPAASRVRGIVATGGVRGVDPASGELPAEAADQVALMFANLRRVIEQAGATVDDILKVTIWIARPEIRALLNEPWTSLFPDAESRPARHVLNYELPGGMVIQCEALAVLDQEGDSCS